MTKTLVERLRHGCDCSEQVCEMDTFSEQAADRIEALEADKASLKEKLSLYLGGWPSLEQRIERLEAKLKRVEEVRDDLATQCINDRAYHAVKMLNKALKEKDDE